MELRNGFPVLLVDFGTGTIRVEQKQIRLTDGEVHHIDIYWSKTVSILFIEINSCIFIIIKKDHVIISSFPVFVGICCHMKMLICSEISQIYFMMLFIIVNVTIYQVSAFFRKISNLYCLYITYLSYNLHHSSPKIYYEKFASCFPDGV